LWQYALAPVAVRSRSGARLAAVDAAFRSLPERYLGSAPGVDATFQIRLVDVGHIWEVRTTPQAVRVRKGTTRREPDVVITTDAETWLRLRAGELSGVDAFGERRLTAKGAIDLAVGFEGMFRLHGGRDPLLRIHDVPVGKNTRISTLTMGAGPDVVLIHGLGATKASFFDTAAALAQDHRVHAIDLPGFGSSSKPLNARYTARWMADNVIALLDTLGIERARFVGNSLGGKVALEVALAAPERTVALGLLCPAVAFVRREAGAYQLIRLARPELGMLPHRFTRGMIESQFWALFADRDAVDPAMAEVAVHEFQRTYHSAAARRAFLTTARSIYLEAPFGRNGFYPRLAELRTPALFVWGSHDAVIPPGFSRHVAEWLPAAEQITLEGCGHVPQIERPEQTNGLLRRFFARADALGSTAGHGGVELAA